MKQGQAIQTLIYLGIVGVILVVFGMGLAPLFAEEAKEAIEKGTCEMTVVLAALTQAGSVGLIEVPPSCKMREVTITEDMINENIGYARARFNVYQRNSKKYTPEKLGIFAKQDEQTEKEFALDRIVAEELKDCWQKVVKGKLPIYDNEYFDASVNCIICSEIRFDDSVIRDFGGRRIESLPAWMAINPMSTNLAYWKYILDGQSGVTGLMQPRYDFEVSETPLAIVFTNIRTTTAEWSSEKLGSLVGWAGASATQDVNALRIVPSTHESIRGVLGCDPTREVK